MIIPIELYGVFHFRFQHVFTYIDTDFLIKAVDEDSFKSDRLCIKQQRVNTGIKSLGYIFR